MLVEVLPDYEALSDRAAAIVTAQIQNKPDSVIGFATGSTPLGLYKRLIRNHQEGGLDFSKVTTFNLDEYVGLPPYHDQSYHYFMWHHLFDHINATSRSTSRTARSRTWTTTASGTRSRSRRWAASICRSSASAPTGTWPSTSRAPRSARAHASRR